MSSHDGDRLPASLDEILAQSKAAVIQNVRMQHRAAEAANANRIEAIIMAISFGATWTELGAAMGMSRQAANKRFANAVKPRTTRKH